MTTRILQILFVCFLTGMVSCIDSYDPEITTYENLLVVDGNISNEPGPYIVRLSLSSSVADPQFIPVVNATIKILNNLGDIFLLSETEPGIYQTDPTATGVVGRSYKIEVITATGKVYYSHFEEIKKPVAIDTVFHEIVTRQHADYDYDLYGYEFLVNTEVAEDHETYFKWDLEATYQYQSEYTIRWYYDGVLHWFHGPDSLYNCWKSNKINSIYISATNALSEPIVSMFPLNFVSTETREISVRYSLLVKQRSISKEAYTYWNEVKKQNGGGSSLYSTQPYFIRGNVFNQADPEEPVLGYFMVNGGDEVRTFVDRAA